MKTSLKTLHNNTLFVRSCLPLVGAMSLGIVASGWLAQARAENVDSEMVLLVDIVRPELSKPEFDRLMAGYATAFTSSQVLDSIQAGAYGRIAISLMLYGGSSTQVVGIPWMTIGNAAEAQSFAARLQNVSRPLTFDFSDPGPALTAAAAYFGSETGHAGNGFESEVQIIEVASAGLPSANLAASTAQSSANALISGVDLINALALGNFSRSIEDFYADNVVGSTIEGVAATSSRSSFNGTLGPMMTGMINGSVQTGATVSVTAVPEPATLAGLIPATLLLLTKRRR